MYWVASTCCEPWRNPWVRCRCHAKTRGGMEMRCEEISCWNVEFFMSESGNAWRNGWEKGFESGSVYQFDDVHIDWSLSGEMDRHPLIIPRISFLTVHVFPVWTCFFLWHDSLRKICMFFCTSHKTLLTTVLPQSCFCIIFYRGGDTCWYPWYFTIFTCEW